MAKVKGKSERKELVYRNLVITCACGAEFESGSTLESIRVDICSQCHPFFTGEDRIMDIEGRVEKFRRKYEKNKVEDTDKKKT
jgi:large subunit ribosomal protein L31